MLNNQNSKDETLGYKANYDLIDKHWAKMRTALPEKDQLLFNQFFSLTTPGSTVLDIGCGSGNPIAKQMSKKGFNIHGVDRSAQLLKQAQRNIPNANFKQAEIEEFDVQRFSNNHTLGGIVCWDVLFHIPRIQQAKAIEKMAKFMKVNTPIILSSGGSETDIPPFRDLMFGVEFFYDAFPIPELIHLCESFGLTLITKSMVNVPDGKRDKGRVGLIFTKHPS